MSDAFYSSCRRLALGPWHASARPVVLGRQHTDRPGPYLLAANHTCPYDIPVIVIHTRRRVDFVSITEVFQNPVVAWFYGAMNAFPLDRSRQDPKAVRVVFDRLNAGRVVAIFPEGGFRTGANSILEGGGMRPGLGRMARATGAPVIPCAIIGTEAYRRWDSWLPLRRTRYGVAYAEPMPPPRDRSEIPEFEAAYRERMIALARELRSALG